MSDPTSLPVEVAPGEFRYVLRGDYEAATAELEPEDQVAVVC